MPGFWLRARRQGTLSPMTLQNLDLVEALQQLMLRIQGHKVVTVLGPGGSQSFEIAPGGQIGPEADGERQLRQKLDEALQDSGSLIIRQILHLQVEIKLSDGSSSWVPQKKLYGAALKQGRCYGLHADQLRQAFSIDHDGHHISPAADELYAEFPKI